VRLAPLALAGLLTAAPAGARAEDWRLDASVLLHARVTRRRAEPRTEVRLSPDTLRFDAADYLRPADDSGYPSAYAAAALEGRRGRWRFQFAADTGEVRRAPGRVALDVCAPRQGNAIFVRSNPDGCLQPPQPGTFYRLPSAADGPRALALAGRPAGDELRESWLLREAWVGASLGPNDFAFVRAGRHRFTVADGFVYDDFGLGLEARLDLGALGPSWDLGAALFWPTRDWPAGAARRSPLLLLRADWLPSLFEHVGAFVALARDQDGEVPALFDGARLEGPAARLQALEAAGAGQAALRQESLALADALTETPASGTSSLVWAGLAGDLAPWRRHRVSFVAAICAGSVQITAPREIRSEVLGTMASAAWEVRVRAAWLLGARLLWLSGGAPPAEAERLGLPRRYGGFIGLAPWITATNLFFRGGLSETFAARQASAPGVNGRGVYGPIVRAAWDPDPGLRAEARAALLLAPVVGPTGGRVYGPEVDLNLRWSPFAGLALTGEADALWPGSFYGGHRPVTRLIAGIELSAP
jgi:hypothetical protein